MSRNDELYEKQLDEFKYIVEHYILKLLGLTTRAINNISNKDGALLNYMIYYLNDSIYFKANEYSNICCKVDAKNWGKISNFNYEIKTLKKILEYDPFGLSKNKNIFYKDINQKMLSYEYALEYGLCLALVERDVDCTSIYKLIIALEQWSCKTYEGKKVPFAFVIDVNEEAPKDAVNYLDFLKSDFSATITDGISSIIELDSNCKLKRYLSICENDFLDHNELSLKMMPLRFAQVLYKYVTGKRIGVFLLVNGDIMLAKNGELLYVKRNNKWINIHGERYISTLNEIYKHKKNNGALYKSIYETTLDVSFAHSGGIIAIVDSNKFLESTVMNFMDNLLENNFISSDEERNVLFDKYVKQFEERNKTIYNKAKHKYIEIEFNKMISKRLVIKQLLSLLNNSKIPFEKIDRKLRAELCGLDGATILDLNGNVIAFGAIIQNNSGSSGGGRGAAASRLSDFGGFATKISTDGYIELYKAGEVCYQIK